LPYSIDSVTKAGESVEIFVNLKAPALPGQYHAIFRLVEMIGEKGIEFGEKAMLDLRVEARPSEVTQPPKPAQPIMASLNKVMD